MFTDKSKERPGVASLPDMDVWKCDEGITTHVKAELS